MKIIKSACALLISSLAFNSFAYQSSPTKTITVRVPEISSSVPESCKDSAEVAYDMYIKDWRTNLFTPLNVDQSSIDKVETRISEEADSGRISLNQHLAPRGTVPVFLDYADLTGALSSLFINCEKRVAYVSRRGNINDALRWFGPFKF